MTAMIVFAVVVLMGGGIAYAAQRHREQQRARLRAIAAANGLQIDLKAKPPPPVDFDLFDVGGGKQVSAQMWRPGEQDSVFQYQYTVKSGNNSSSTYEFTAAMIKLPFRAPHMTISTESWWSKIKRAVGLRDIEVESPQFNDHYHVRCSDERFAISLLDPAMIAWTLSPASGHGAVTFELLGPWMLCHGSQLKPEELPEMLAWAQSVRTQLPAVLTDLYGRS